MLTKEERNTLYKLCDETHIMIAGTTGSGKSVFINNLLCALTSYPTDSQRLVLIDLKRVELSRWEDDPHVLRSITEPEDVNKTLDWLIDVMEKRYRAMKKKRLVKSQEYYITVVIDELAEVMRVKGAEARIDTLLRLARASNIQLIMATQNPSRTSGIPARIFQNVSCCVGLRCKTAIESRQIIGLKGCEELPRYGKAYISNPDGLFLVDVPIATKEDFNITHEAWYSIA